MWKFVELRNKTFIGSKVDIGFINYYYSPEPFQQLHNFISVQAICRRVIGRTQPNYFCVYICCIHYFIGLYIKIFIQHHFTILHIVNIGTHFIHPISRIYSHNIIFAWLAKSPVQKINGFVTSVSKKDSIGFYIFYFRNLIFHLALMWIGISIKW
ncbi:hypothetical protein SDC9_159782 [bioreactor metagenome]|uniref:Uncharacterized protein n=1 Tax=bioreactor metagenome TaxID=1076179 RepID=A0A645FJ55_9ZZZZ